MIKFVGTVCFEVRIPTKKLENNFVIFLPNLPMMKPVGLMSTLSNFITKGAVSFRKMTILQSLPV